MFPSHLGSEALSVGLVEGVMFAEPLISTEIGAGTCYVDSPEESDFVVLPSDSSGL